ncbi:MAG: hypothetical protein HRU09_15385 [Oligoflexales bacterium]|nr:hypothetical protein [Oligoflexales bacterium]
MRTVSLFLLFLLVSCSDDVNFQSNAKLSSAQDKVINEELLSYSLADLSTLQAEDAILNRVDVATNKIGFYGQGFADYKGSDSSVTWDVDYPAGYYVIEVRYGSGDDRPSTLIINNDLEIDLKLEVQGSRAWTNWVTETTDEFLTEVPIRSISIAADGKSPGPSLDQIKVVLTASLPEPEPPETQGVLQAENAIGYNVSQQQNHPGYRGEGFADFGTLGSYVEWSGLNYDPGLYRLVFHYGGGDSRPSSLIVNGAGANQNVIGDNRYPLAFSASEPPSWSEWVTEEIVIDTLGEGLSSLIVNADRSTGTNLDQVEIYLIQNEEEEDDYPPQTRDMINQAAIMAAGDYFDAANGSEGIENIYDNNSDSKWLHKAPISHIRFDFPSEFILEEYYLTSANDAPGRDPSSWLLLASNNPDEVGSWVELSLVEGVVFEQRHQEKQFLLTGNNTPYRSYMFFDIHNSGAPYIQLADIRFKASPGSQTSAPSLCETPWSTRDVSDDSICVFIDDNSPSYFDLVSINDGIDNPDPSLPQSIPFGSSWHYHAENVDPGADWMTKEFDDRAWPLGNGQLGYGDGDEATTVSGGSPSAYFRKKVSINEGLYAVHLDLLHDDGAAVWVNGAEVLKKYMENGTAHEAYASKQSTDNERAKLVLDSSYFDEGPNTIAVLVKQVLPTSSDLSFDLELLPIYEDEQDDDPETGDEQARIKLPIEVIGEEGKLVQQSIELSAATASSVKAMYLRINNLGYEDKASVRVNNGAWLSLNHDSVEIEEGAKRRGGMVHGGYGTMRLEFNVENSFHAGQNLVEFRFNHSDGISIGYRIIEFNLKDQQGRNLLDNSWFVLDDPNSWEPPYSDMNEIKAGEVLWKNAPLWSHYLEGKGNWYNHEIGVRSRINAKCADCHTHDGRDLEIFAYSNESIIERSKFHGLTEDEGKKIASYIRNLSSSKEKVGRYGRPWNPPYQPGPSIAQRPVHEWAAGAGLDAVLEQDSDMLIGMFGRKNNITKAQVQDYFDSDKMWNTATQALALQLPDWKHWLPLCHPKDCFSRNDYYNNPNKTRDPKKGYQGLRNYLEGANGNFTATKLFSELHKFWLNFRLFLEEGSSVKNHWRSDEGNAFKNGLKNGVHRELAATSLARLLAVKFFEVHHEFDLQGIAKDIIPAEEQPRDRQWLGRQYNVFEVPPHFTGCYFNNGTCYNFSGQQRETGVFESTSWYQLQQVINPGIATSRDVVPVDYNYQPQFILRASQSSNIMEPVRFYYSSNVMYQTRTRVEVFTPNDKEGFNMRAMGPWGFLGADNRNSTQGLSIGKMPELLNSRQANLGTWIVEAQLEQFLKEMNKSRNSLDRWKRRSSNNSGEHKWLDPISLKTSDMPSLSSQYSGKTRHYAQKIYWVIPRYIDSGVDCSIINRLKDWYREAWPNVSLNNSAFNCP